VRSIEAPALVFTGDRDMIELDLIISLYRMLPRAELAVAPATDHIGAISPERAGLFARLIRDFAARHTSARR
jgi:pimeloyl-ACP methyl ester carboxylesterase